MPDLNEAISASVADALLEFEKLEWAQAVTPEIRATIRAALDKQEPNTEQEDAIITLAGMITFIEQVSSMV